jgi:hypothetical protein
MCQHCKEVMKAYEISSQTSFSKALCVIRDNLADGTIIESAYWPKGIIKTCHTPFSQVTAEGPYTEDVYEYYFQCPACKQLFHLSCNTYHGNGGEWRPVNENDF